MAQATPRRLIQTLLFNWGIGGGGRLRGAKGSTKVCIGASPLTPRQMFVQSAVWCLKKRSYTHTHANTRTCANTHAPTHTNTPELDCTLKGKPNEIHRLIYEVQIAGMRMRMRDRRRKKNNSLFKIHTGREEAIYSRELFSLRTGRTVDGNKSNEKH